MAETVPITSLVLDFTVYPRGQVAPVHVTDMIHSLEAGHSLPPIVADHASRRVVDGFHRVKAIQRFAGDDATIEVEWRDYADEAALFRDAMALNAHHGRGLSHWDQKRSIQIGQRLGLAPEDIAGALSLTVERLGELALDTGIRPDGGLEPLKRTMIHKRGQPMTPDELEANRKASGLSPLYYLRQVANLLEREALNRDDERIRAELERLVALITTWLARAA